MKKNKFTKKELIDLLIKKASGFYYNEEQFEYEKSQSLKKNMQSTEDIQNIKNAKISINDAQNILKNDIYEENCAENNKIEISLNCENDIKNQSQINTEKTLKKVGRVCNKTDKCGDMMVVSNEANNSKQGYENLTLIKRKVATHFVPPDMIAIKILFEIFEKKVDDSEIENMSDEELFKFKTKLLEEIKDENI